VIYNIPESLLLKCTDNSTLKELAFFYELKKEVGNSVYYNYSINRMSSKTGYSRTKLSKYISFFLKTKWCIIKDNHLHFLKNSLITKKLKTIKIECEAKDLILHFKLHLLKRKQKQCLYAYKARRDHKNMLNGDGRHYSLQDVKSVIKRRNKVRRDRGEISGQFRLSNAGAAKVFKCSVSSAGKLLLKMEKESLLMISRRRSIVRRCSYQESLQIRASLGLKKCFWTKGMLFEVESNVLNILPSILDFKKATIKSIGCSAYSSGKIKTAA
jgi:hypothetical protein